MFLGEQVFVLEFKMAEGDARTTLDEAICQMRDRGYAETYRDRGKPIHLVGIAFEHVEQNLLGVMAEPA